MDSFIYDGLPSRVIFGAGSIEQVGDEIARLGVNNVLVLSTPRQRDLADAITGQLAGRAAGVFDGAVMHVPAPVAAAACDLANRLGADACIALGGGSPIGLGKAIALQLGLPTLAVPTTYAGSEMTTIWGLTEDGVKRTGRDPRVLPKTVIYDPELTLSLPPAIAGPSGMNALAHCVEALYSDTGNPITSLMAQEGIAALARSLPKIVADPGDLAARSDALYGAWLAGASLGSVGMALHHKLSHTLGGSCNLPHAQTHCVLLPHVAAFNQSAAPAAMARMSRAMGVADTPSGLHDLARAIGAPTALKDIGMAEADLDKAADLATQRPYYNPRPVTRQAIRQLLDDAFYGRHPRPATLDPLAGE